MLLQLQDFGTSFWQIQIHAISLPARLIGRVGGSWPDPEAPAHRTGKSAVWGEPPR
jgi:hypothetical protein